MQKRIDLTALRNDPSETAQKLLAATFDAVAADKASERALDRVTDTAATAGQRVSEALRPNNGLPEKHRAIKGGIALGLAGSLAIAQSEYQETARPLETNAAEMTNYELLNAGLIAGIIGAAITGITYTLRALPGIRTSNAVSAFVAAQREATFAENAAVEMLQKYGFEKTLEAVPLERAEHLTSELMDDVAADFRDVGIDVRNQSSGLV